MNTKPCIPLIDKLKDGMVMKWDDLVLNGYGQACKKARPQQVAALNAAMTNCVTEEVVNRCEEMKTVK